MKRRQFWTSLLTNLAKVKNFKQIPVRGTTSEEVLALWREGRLYVEVNNLVAPETLLAMCQREALMYVNAIHEFVSPEYLPYIKDVWQAVISDEAFIDYLVLRKGRMKGHLNRYVVTNIVEFMRTLDFYHSDSLLVLHKRMEGVDKKTGIYKSAGMYCLSREQRKKLRELKTFYDGLK